MQLKKNNHHKQKKNKHKFKHWQINIVSPLQLLLIKRRLETWKFKNWKERSEIKRLDQRNHSLYFRFIPTKFYYVNLWKLVKTHIAD